MLKRQTGFAIGQRVRKKARGGGVWEIMAIRKDKNGAINIEMFKIDEPTTSRTLSAYVLSDTEQFEIVSS